MQKTLTKSDQVCYDKRDAVEKKTRENVLAKLNEHKKEMAKEPRRKLFHNKQHKPEMD